MKRPTETRMERHIELALQAVGYQSFLSSSYHQQRCQLSEELISFVQATQPKHYEKLEEQLQEQAPAHLCKVVNNQIASRGLIDVLRKGVKTKGCHFKLLYFKPKSGLNPTHHALYEQNRFGLVRQLQYSSKNNKSIDMVLFLNGLPILTMELKNQLTGQSLVDAEKQYQQDRNPKGEPLLQFRRCLVHFCVDNDKASMTTRLAGEDTYFLPYNRGIVNPTIEGDYATAYLWKDIWRRDSLLDIIENFVFLIKEDKHKWSEAKQAVVIEKDKVGTLIFPRYHQLDVIRALRKQVVQEGPGHNYLIQHTTGAGKSYSIGWLAHTLTSLYQNETATQRIFDTILVVTDRRVLDKQLQDTLRSLAQTEGVVHPVEKSAQQLKQYLQAGKDIIVTTVQKFPVISSTMQELQGTNFAVIVDEVHSSQSGNTSKHLKKSLGLKVEEEKDQEEEEPDFEDLLNQEIAARGRQSNVSFFGFTGTPKNKTLELFGRANAQGVFEPFHAYTMQQSIHENFTLDVLVNYTTYNRYFKVVQKAQQDSTLPEAEAMKKLVEYVDNHDETIRQKVTIMLDHFTSHTFNKIKGQAKAMVVLRSRLHCVYFFQQMKKQMQARGLPYTCLVAFSGTVKDKTGMEYTEKALNKANGMPNTSIKYAFKSPKFRILIVASKFQTGFDEPLLQTMYVDKKLGSVQCVQTLSRLNRTKSGKVNTFVLDFVNDPEDIQAAFQPFYTTTVLTQATDPDKLYTIQYKIEGYNLFTDHQVDQFCKELLKETPTDEKLQPILQAVVNAWKALEEQEQKEFKSAIQSFIRLYAYLAQIATFQELQWEKLYLFLTYLNKKLPKQSKDDLDISEAIDLDSLRIKMMGTSTLSLEDKVGEATPIYESSTAAVGGEIPMDLLSQIIERINEVFGGEIGEQDKLDVLQVAERLKENEALKASLKGNNSEEDKLAFYEELLQRELINFYATRTEFYKKVNSPKIFPLLRDGLYREFMRWLRG